MDLWRFLSGSIQVELTSPEPDAAFRVIAENNITVFHTRFAGEFSVCFSLRRRDYQTLSALCRARGDRLRVIGKKGAYWKMLDLLRRPLVPAGIILYFALALFLPTRVLQIQVEGNERLPDRLILEAAESSGICFGTSCRQVRSERVKNDLLERLPELKWAGVNTYGSRAVISVREREEGKPKADSRFGSIVALRDGVILSCTATRGTLVCREGEAVRAGQLLISGYTDCGNVIRASRAEGEVYAETRRLIRAVAPVKSTLRGNVVQQKYCIGLLIGKKRINLWKDSRIWDGTCGRMYEEYYITLPGGYRLPVALTVESITVYDSQTHGDSQQESLLEEQVRAYLADQMIAGEILDGDVAFSEEEGACILTGSYLCREMIGRIQQEQIGE